MYATKKYNVNHPISLMKSILEWNMISVGVIELVTVVADCQAFDICGKCCWQYDD